MIYNDSYCSYWIIQVVSLFFERNHYYKYFLIPSRIASLLQTELL